MSRKSLGHLHCSWAQAVEAIGDKWSIMIIRDAFYGVRTFSAFTQRIGISKNILSQRLEHLQSHDIIEKRLQGVGSTRFEYRLTAKGLATFPIIIALSQWGDEWIYGNGNEPLSIVDSKNNRPIEIMKVRDDEGNDLTIEDIEVIPGPGAKKS